MDRSIIDYSRFAVQVLTGWRVRHECGFAEARERDTARYLPAGRPLEVLDVANGRLRPQFTLLKAAGHRVYGVDLINRPSQSMTDRAYRVAREVFVQQLGVPP